MKKFLAIIVSALLLVGASIGLTACGEGNKVKVGSQSGTTGFNFASYIKGVEAVAYDTHALAAQDMLNGKLDYVICDGATADSIIGKIDGLKKIEIALTSENYAIGVDPAQASLLTSINTILASKVSEINEILNKEEDDFIQISSATYDASKDQLVVATNAEFAPFEYTDGEYFKGIDMEIAKLIADELGWELVIRDMAFEAVVSAVGKNGVDIVIAGLTVTTDRAATINFSAPYYTEAQYVIAKESDTSLDECGTVLDVLSVIGKQN
ncbi:MAG: transporter substrate-binding domain-containing protein [Clostridia bacterium]|nr:transporter substrate-binding domain-containing protein [Clostridia bacterium]